MSQKKIGPHGGLKKLPAVLAAVSLIVLIAVIVVAVFVAVLDVTFGYMRDLLATNVMELATRDVVCVQEGDALEDVCALLSAHRLKKVPVVRDGALVGTVSRSDIVRSIMQRFAA